jgi:SAM-dependent methyltransferase
MSETGVALLPPKFRQDSIIRSGQFGPVIEKDKNQIYLDLRGIEEYCIAGGLTDQEIMEWGNLEERSRRLGRPVRIGDIGCGDGDFVRTFWNEPGVEIVGIDRRIGNIKKDNVEFIGGDALTNKQFWRKPFDYLWCVVMVPYATTDVNGLIKLMKKGLAKDGKGYLVVPKETDWGEWQGGIRHKGRFSFDQSLVTEKVTMVNTVDKTSGLNCVSIKIFK